MQSLKVSQRVYTVDDVGVRIGDFNNARMYMRVQSLSFNIKCYLAYEAIPTGDLSSANLCLHPFSDDATTPIRKAHGGDWSELIDQQHPWAGEVFARAEGGYTVTLAVQEVSM